MNDKPKLVQGLPPPPEVTEEMRKEVLEASRAWSKYYAKRVKGMTNLTAEDWRAIVR